MSEAADEYRRLNWLMLKARADGDEVREDQILDQMDAVWLIKMTEEDRETWNQEFVN